MPPHPLTLRQASTQPGAPQLSVKPPFDYCSSFKCWTHSQQAGVIAAAILVGLVILALLFYLRPKKGKIRPDAGQRSDPDLPPENKGPSNSIPRSYQVQGSIFESVRPQTSSNSHPNNTVIDSVYPRAPTSATGVRSGTGQRRGSIERSNDMNERDSGGSRERQDTTRWSTEAVGDSIPAKQRGDAGNCGVPDLRRRSLDPGMPIKPRTRSTSGPVGQSRHRAKETPREDDHRFIGINEVSEMSDNSESRNEGLGPEEQDSGGWKSKVTEILEKVLEDSKWLPVLPAVLTLINLMAEPRGGWEQYHKDKKRFKKKMKQNGSSHEVERRNRGTRESSRQHRQKAAPNRETKQSSTDHGRQSKKQDDREPPSRGIRRADSRTSERHTSNLQRRPRVSKTGRHPRSHTHRPKEEIRVPPRSRRKVTRLNDNGDPTLAPRTRFREMVSVAPRSINSSVKHIPLNDLGSNTGRN